MIQANIDTTQNSKIIMFFAPQATRERRQHRTRTSKPQMRFSEVLAGCPAKGDIIPSLCQAARLPVGYLPLERAWPWLKQRIEVPCGCGVRHPSALLVLCHLFDRHVTDLEDWSMQDLVEWGTRTQDTMEASGAGE